MAERGVWEVWAGVVCGGEGEGDPGGNGSSRVLHPAQFFVSAVFVFVGLYAFVGVFLYGRGGVCGGEKSADRGVDEGEEEDGGKESDGEDEEEVVRGEEFL